MPSAPMFEVLDESKDDLVAVCVGRGTRQGYADFYSLLAEKTEEHGTINVYEEVPNGTFLTSLSHLHGIIPDLRYGSEFNINRYVVVGDSVWAKLLFEWWCAIRRIWPAAPTQMGYFDVEDSEVALTWVRESEKINDDIVSDSLKTSLGRYIEFAEAVDEYFHART